LGLDIRQQWRIDPTGGHRFKTRNLYRKPSPRQQCRRLPDLLPPFLLLPPRLLLLPLPLPS
jgi:hypothetical protein